jgi:hypothetical protein
MALIGYTHGGSPIYFSTPSGGKRQRKNPRFKCSHDCGAKTTLNQRRINGNLCHRCRKPFKHRDGL